MAHTSRKLGNKLEKKENSPGLPEIYQRHIARSLLSKKRTSYGLIQTFGVSRNIWHGHAIIMVDYEIFAQSQRHEKTDFTSQILSIVPVHRNVFYCLFVFSPLM